MSTAPNLTIVTPVLNGERFIPDLISSLQSQTNPDWEHIIVDGGSTDRTVEIIKAAYSGDKRLRLIERPGLGLYESLLLGFDHARANLIGWQNADDLYTPWAFQAVCDFHQRTQSDWVTGLPGCWDEAGTLRFVRPYGWYPSSLIKRGWFHSELLGFLQQESTFFSRRAFEALSPSDLKQIGAAQHAGDFLLWRVLARTHKLNVMPTVVSGFRRHQTNRSVAHMDEYLSEVRASGAVFLPPFLARFSRRIFRAVSATAALSRVEREDRIFLTNG